MYTIGVDSLLRYSPILPQVSASTHHSDTGCASPGSFKYGSSEKMRLWIEIRTWRRVLCPEIQPGPCHVPSRLKHTFYIGHQRQSPSFLAGPRAWRRTLVGLTPSL